MNAERWGRIEEIFDLTADLPAAEQERVLGSLPGVDQELLDEVRRLLARDRAGSDQLAQTIEMLSHIAPPAERSFVGRMMGPYQVVREVGRGGMGVVFEAVRADDQYHKRVALKVAVRAAYSAEFQQRFRNERQILAQLEHPHIARLLDGGTTDENIPFFALEYVEGEPIDVYAASRNLPLTERIRLFLQVCAAVEYAHQNLVIHRDLKPGNILVADGFVRLLDFGIAKLIAPGDGGQTQTGVAVTPDYCSPEQVSGQRITTRTDVYSLGLVLYKLLTGQRAQLADSSSPLTLVKTVCETPIEPPSVRMAGAKTMARQLRGDLDTITMTAVHKDPSQRYASVAALGEDLRRYLAGQPIVARQNSGWYSARRFAQRHWLPLTGLLLVVVMLVAGIVGVSYQKRQAERRFAQVRRVANALINDVHKAIRDLPASTKAQEVVVRTALEYLDGIEKEAGSDRWLQLEIADGYGRIAQIQYSLNRPSLGQVGPAKRSFEKAKAMMDVLYAANGEDPAIATSTAKAYHAMGLYRDETSQHEAGMKDVERAIEIAEAALKKNPAHKPLLEISSAAHSSLITRFMHRAPLARFLPRYLEIAETMAKNRPEGAAALSQLGRAYGTAGAVAQIDGDAAVARQYLARSVELQSQAVKLLPNHTVLRHNLVAAWQHLGDWSLGDAAPTLGGYCNASQPLAADRRQDAFEAYRQALVHSEWNFSRDPNDDTLRHDHALVLGRSSSTYPAGDPRAIAPLEQSLAMLQEMEPRFPRLRRFILEFRCSLAQRRRETGQFALALRQWQAAEAMGQKWMAGEPDDPFSRRYLIPVYQHWAMELAHRGDRTAALNVAQRAERMAAELMERQAVYTRAPRWPARVQGWLAELQDRLGDREAAGRARAASMQLWRAISTRTDLPDDLRHEALAVVASAH